jgi:hypothetical protein
MNKVNTKQKNTIVKLHNQGMTFREIGERLGIAGGTVKTHYHLATGQPSYVPIPVSRYVRYDDPPVIEGDALILPDCEIPFHNADFMNKCIELASSWGIETMIAAGDLMHMDSLSGWEPNWTAGGRSGLSEANESKLMKIALSLPEAHQQELLDTITELGDGMNGGDFSGEMNHARVTIAMLNANFEKFVWVLGNHEGRLLRALDSPTNPSELLALMRLDEGKWEIAPFYYCLLKSGGRTFRVTHPKSAANGTARQLASQFFQDILMGHSHKMFCDWDPSGTYWAMQIGHCVDENRLAYVAQRDCKRDSHMLGAVIVRNGYPWLLNKFTDWESMRRMG